MPTLLHTADLHVGLNQYGLKQRGADLESTFRHMLQQAETEDVDAILLARDLFDSRDIRPRTLETVNSILEETSIPIVVSPGSPIRT